MLAVQLMAASTTAHGLVGFRVNPEHPPHVAAAKFADRHMPNTRPSKKISRGTDIYFHVSKKMFARGIMYRPRQSKPDLGKRKQKNKKPAAQHEDAPLTPVQSPEEYVSEQTHTLLPVTDLQVRGGGAWNLQNINWKKSTLAQIAGDHVLRVFYGKNSGTSADPGVGGIVLSAEPGGLPAREATFAFDVYFARGWNFSQGGKIGGLFVGTGDASGYAHSPTASSHRIMWQKDGGAISYLYPPSGLPQTDPTLQDSGHGIGYFKDIFPAGTLKVGAWNSVVLGVKLNTFSASLPNADGVATLQINGVRGVKNDIRWARSPDLLITSLQFNTFFGGPDPAVCDCTAYYKNFKLAATTANQGKDAA